MVPLITPQWPAPKNIKAYTTLRYPGHSQDVYAGFNLATHVGDNTAHVQANRHALIEYAHLPSEPKWLNQVHSNIAVLAENIPLDEEPNADASYTQKMNTVCVVMTADCLPILITNQEGSEVAAIHAGWRGLANDVIENTLSALQSPSDSLMAWIGPSISQASYEVDEEVYAAFAKKHSQAECQQAFKMKDAPKKKWLADMPFLAKQRLFCLGIPARHIYLSNECTYAQAGRYFSYRRDGVTGRMASLIFIRS